MVNIIHIMLAFCFMFYFISSTSVASGNYTKEKCILQMVRANILMAKQLKVGMLASGQGSVLQSENAKKRQGSVLQSENAKKRQGTDSADSGVEKNEEKDSTKNNYTIHPFGSQKAFHVLVPLCDHLEKVEKIKMEDNKADSGVEKNEEKDDKGVEKNEEKDPIKPDSVATYNIGSNLTENAKKRQGSVLQSENAKKRQGTDSADSGVEKNEEKDDKGVEKNEEKAVLARSDAMNADSADSGSKLILKDLLKTCTNLWGSGEIKKVIKLNDLLSTCYDVNKFYGFRVDNAEIVKIANDPEIVDNAKTAMIAKERSKLFVDVFYNLKNTCEFLFLYGQNTHISDISFTAEDFLPLCILAKRNRNEEFFKETPIDFCDALN